MAKGDIKRRREIERLSASLPSLTSAQEWEAQQACGTAWIGAKKGWCDVCAREFDSDLWNTKKKLTVCPHCGAKLTIKRSPNKRTETTKYYWHIITVAGDWQVVRTFSCRRVAERAGWYGRELLNPSHAYIEVTEVFQRYFKKDEKTMLIGLAVRGMHYYSDQWKWDSKWQIRQYKPVYSVWGWMSKDQQLLPILRQRGLKKMNAECSPYEQIESVFYDEKAEILLKKKADKLFAAFINRNRNNVYSHWQTIRVALRHNYKPKDVGMWLDLLDLLRMNGKDLHNPHFICPTNLKKAHDVQHAIRERALEKQRIERERREAARLAEKLSDDGKTNLEYVEKMGAFLGITLKLGNVTLQPLQNIREFFEEGSELCHCVFTNNYYKHPDCLIIGARVDGKRTETIEIDTKNWKVVQCRGKHNQPSKYHERILNLMNRNMYKFRNVAL